MDKREAIWAASLAADGGPDDGEWAARFEAALRERGFVMASIEELTALGGELKSAIDQALELIVQYGQTDGDHHKAWVLDQVTRVLTGADYEKFVADACDGEDGPDTYDWDVGVPP